MIDKLVNKERNILERTFEKSRQAWSFMRHCDDIGHMAGYPHPTDEGKYTVRYIPNGKTAKK